MLAHNKMSKRQRKENSKNSNPTRGLYILY